MTDPSNKEENSAKGLAHKQAADAAFKEGDFMLAVKEYHTAVLHLRGLDSSPLSLAKVKGEKDVKEEDITEGQKLMSTIYSNMALCHMRLGRPARVTYWAKQALAVNPFNAKAKFRLVQGLVREGATIKAAALLDELEKAGPEDPAFAAERRNIEAMDRKADAKQRKELAGMFDRANKDAKEAEGTEETKDTEGNDAGRD
ncbi:hypothetical protein H4R18_003327 [Coemansia javaensis]|uniref:TPR-like protein n=1 Tax=Coemansia javaensis TaxID=2761396 RepID=A0A9W8LIL4_9FUNG|nr:hypothetical protein H4R18_003327 [Coemansia javaensis]